MVIYCNVYDEVEIKMDILIKRNTILSAVVIFFGLLPSGASAVVTAFLDTGIAGTALDSVIVGGFDFVNNDDDPDDQSPILHGTDQARIFNDSAPGQQLLLLKTYEQSAAEMNLVTGQAAMDFANADSRVKVLAINRLQPIDVGRLQVAVANDTVVVINAGNSGADTLQNTARLVPFLLGGGIVAVSHQADGTIASGTNRPGATFAEHTIAALGTSPRSSTFGNSFSMARVAAVAARVKSAAGFLTPAEIVEILKVSATDAGEPGVDGVYGHGLLNASAALAAIGTTSVATGNTASSSSSSGGAAAGGALIIGSGLYALLKKDKKLKKTLILDQFGRGYVLDLTRAAPKRDVTPTLNLVMANLKSTQHTVVTSATEDVQSYAVIRAAEEDRSFVNSFFPSEQSQNVSLSFHTVHSDGRKVSFGLNEGMKSQFGVQSILPDEVQTIGFINSETMSAPLMGFTNQGLSSVMGFRRNDATTVKIGLASLDDEERWGLKSDSVMVETSYENDKVGIGFQLGRLDEQGSLFGGSSNGAFSVDSAKTLSVGLSGQYRLGQSTSLVGTYTRGVTDVTEQEQGLLKDFSTIDTDSFGLGMVSSSVFKKDDAFGVGIFQPLRVIRGSVDTDVPFARDDDGTIFKSRDRFNLNPDGREQIMELYYRTNVGHDMQLGSHVLYRSEAYHDKDSPDEKAIMFTLSRDL